MLSRYYIAKHSGYKRICFPFGTRERKRWDAVTAMRKMEDFTRYIIKIICSSVSDPDPLYFDLPDTDPLYFDLPDPDPNPFYEMDLNTYSNSKKSPKLRKK